MKQNLNKMMCLDLYLSGNENITELSYKNSVLDNQLKTLPLISWDVFSERYFIELNKAKRAMDIRKIKAYAKRHGWENNLNSIFKSNDFEAIVLTDKSQTIIWVNEGFTTMTGYSKKETLGQSPRFLQGKRTFKKAISEIARNLKKGEPFRSNLVNYRKNKTAYNCEISIYPLYNNKETTHYIALEKEVI
ncbi:MAG: PAS domain-containing protein [Flavobacteriaceae bacterium]